MVKQAVGLLASVAGIVGVALLLGVLVRLSWDSRSGFSLPSPEDKHPPKTDKVLHEA
jgi:hypothetical protein